MFLCPLSCLIGLPFLLVSSVFVIAELQLFFMHFYHRLRVKEIKNPLRPFTHLLTLLLHELIIPGNG